METRLNKMDEKLDRILDKVGDQRERIAKLETNQKGFITLISALMTACVTYIAGMLHLKP